MQIGEISKLTGLSISTLRYYDKHGLLNNLERTDGGIRTFSEQNIEALKLINCLKNSGMKISEIKQFMEWCTEGKKTFNKRLEIFYEQEKNIKEQIDVLNKSLKLIKFKQWYYETAIKEGTEDNVRKLDINKMPKEIAKLYKESHE